MSYPLLNVPARPAGAGWQFHFSPLGNRAPLFTVMRPEGDDAGLSRELDVPGPIRRAFFARDLDIHRTITAPDFTDLYGARQELGTLAVNDEASMFVVVGGEPIPPAEVRCGRLDPWPAAQPAGAIVSIDVVAGRLAVGDGFPTGASVDIEFQYGFPADIGGGPYERRNWLIADDPLAPLERYEVLEGAPPPRFASVAAALSHWSSSPPDRPNAVITILDSRSYDLPASVKLSDLTRLAIEADNGQRPLLRTAPGGLEIAADGTAPDPDVRGSLTLSGVVVEGFLHVTGDVAALRLIHATVVPGRTILDGAPPGTEPAIVVEANDAAGDPINRRCRLEVVSSVCGPIVCPATAQEAVILDSIVDGLGGAAIGGPGGDDAPPLTIERSTVLGTCALHSLEASDCIFTGNVQTARTQSGCVRFSFVPTGSRTPRPYRCQPELAIREALRNALAADPGLSAAEQNAIRSYVAGWLQPAFTATQYGQPAYCQLRLSAPAEIRIGADDGAEMGAYCQLKQPQRESNLRIRLDEYLPFGLDAGLIYVT